MIKAEQRSKEMGFETIIIFFSKIHMISCQNVHFYVVVWNSNSEFHKIGVGFLNVQFYLPCSYFWSTIQSSGDV